ncbi:MAG: tetratricopeptide repeat protein [Verrucomicrobia bacterium]|nr:tetratricopeptide repeat protein [Verrucomicrobiota bacterium]
MIAGLVAYHNSLDGPLILDDASTITANPSIKATWSFGQALSPPDNSTVGGRPLANLTFALNYWLGGESVRGYHLVNLAIHLLAALVLFELVRLTPRAPTPSHVEDPGDSRTLLILATAIALLWSVHPLLTSSVTYISQRTESLMGLCYLFTLFGFVRGVRDASLNWLGFSVFFCAAGMAVKEVMVTAPVIVLLYDRTFFAGSFLDACRLRGRYYLGLCATWVLLAYFLTHGLDQRSVGYGLGVSPSDYALTQCAAVLTYLRLAVWPSPLVFDYGPVFVREWTEVALPGLVLVALLAATVVALVRRPVLGFLAAGFFIPLAPTSSFVPIALQPIAENRVYLPLIAAVALVVLTVHRLASRWTLGICAMAALALTVATMRRNTDYRSEPTLLADTLEKRPQNSRAQFNYANFLADAGRLPEAIPHYEAALRLKPNYPEAHNNYGDALLKLGQPAPALVQFERSLLLRPRSAVTHLNRGSTLLLLGRGDEALAELATAAHLAPANPSIRLAYASGLLQLRRPKDAVVQASEGLRLAPTHPKLLDCYALGLFQSGDHSDAFAHWTRALDLWPDDADIRTNYANALFALGRMTEAATHYATLAQRPAATAADHNNYANALDELGRRPEALSHYATAVRLKPDYPEARYNYGNALLAAEKIPEAIEQLASAVQLRPSYAEAHNSLGAALVHQNQITEASVQFARAVQLQPANLAARSNYAGTLIQLRQWTAAIEQCQLALQSKPDLPRETYFCAVAYTELGNLSAAVNYYERALRLAPNFPEARHGLGLVYFRLGRTTEAIAQIEEAVRLNPQYEEARQNLGRLRGASSKL